MNINLYVYKDDESKLFTAVAMHDGEIINSSEEYIGAESAVFHEITENVLEYMIENRLYGTINVIDQTALNN